MARNSSSLYTASSDGLASEQGLCFQGRPSYTKLGHVNFTDLDVRSTMWSKIQDGHFYAFTDCDTFDAIEVD